MTWLRRLPASALVAICASATSAQQPPPADEQSTIVVTGRANVEKDMKEFVGALTHGPARAIGRWEQQVCPAAVGLSPVQRQLVATRMRRTAAAAGIRVAGPGCAPNVVVVVTSDKKQFLKQLDRKRGDYFGSLSGRQIRALYRDPSPAIAWQLAGPPVNAAGTELREDPQWGYMNQTGEVGSRLKSSSRPQFDGAVVVVERKALEGLTTTQLADYAALRAYAAVDPARLKGINAPTILGVIDAPVGTSTPITMTEWDMAFLRGFYAAPRNISPAGQRSSISKQATDDVLKGPKQQ